MTDMIREHKIAAAIGVVAVLTVLGLVFGLRLVGQGVETATEAMPTPAAATLAAEEAMEAAPAITEPYLGPTVTALADAEVVSPTSDVITQWGRLTDVQGSDPLTLTLDTPNRGEMTFTNALAETDFYFASSEDEFLLYTGDVLELAEHVAGVRGETSIAYAGAPGRPERTVAVLFETGFDASELPGATPGYVEGGGDVTVAPSGLTSTSGQIVALAIRGSQARMALNARAEEPYEFEFEIDTVDFQVMRGTSPDFTYESVDPSTLPSVAGQAQSADVEQARADLLADAEERGLDVTVATVGPPGMDVLAILVQDVAP